MFSSATSMLHRSAVLRLSNEAREWLLGPADTAGHRAHRQQNRYRAANVGLVFQLIADQMGPRGQTSVATRTDSHSIRIPRGDSS
jgi:hypothetical protein